MLTKDAVFECIQTYNSAELGCDKRPPLIDEDYVAKMIYPKSMYGEGVYMNFERLKLVGMKTKDKARFNEFKQQVGLFMKELMSEGKIKKLPHPSFGDPYYKPC